MFARFVAWLKHGRVCFISGSKAIHLPNCSHFAHDLEVDMDEIAKRIASKVLAGIRKDVAAAKKVIKKK